MVPPKNDSRQFKFTRRSAKYLCFIISVSLISAFLLIATFFTLGKIESYSESTHNKTSSVLVKEYATIFDSMFYGIFSELKQLSKSFAMLDSSNENVIFDWLKKNNDLRFNNFENTIFMDLDGNAYASNGLKFDVSKTEPFKHALNMDKSFAAFGPHQGGAEPVETILFMHKVLSPNGQLKGFLTGSLSLSNLKEIITRMNIDNDGTFFLIGDNGKFICHASDDYLGKVCSTFVSNFQFNKEKFFNREVVIADEISEIDNSEMRLFVYKLNSVDWYCGVTIPREFIFAQYLYLRRTAVFVIFAIIFMIALFSTISIILYNRTVTNEVREEVREESYKDPLTGLWSRKKFETEAQKLLDENPDENFVLVDMDFRGFKFVNQNLGKNVADKLLIDCAKTIYDHCQTVNFICGHGYADRFFAMGKIVTVLRFMKVFDEFMEKINATTNEFPIKVYFKYGITYVLQDKEFYKERRSIQDLFSETTYAKTIVKQSVLKSYEFFSQAMQKKIEKDQTIERNMEDALSNGEFVVYYQPKMSLSNEKISGAEALVRWKSSNQDLGFLPPNDFIPLFEKNGFIVQLDFAVYEMVFKFLRAQLDAGNPVVPISVNMSRNHNDPEKFVEEFMNRFEKYNLPTNLIEIEFLERDLEDNLFNLIVITQKLHERGFIVSMDDFGSGQSSLNMLNEVPVDVIKFDKNFLQNGNEDVNSNKMINILIDIGKKLNKKTLFEGVETPEQRDLLKNLKCDQVQGFLYSRPLPATDFVEFIKNNH